MSLTHIALEGIPAHRVVQPLYEDKLNIIEYLYC